MSQLSLLPDDAMGFKKIPFYKFPHYKRQQGFLVQSSRLNAIGIDIIVCKNPHLADHKNDLWWNQRKWCACESETTLWIVQPCHGKETKEAVTKLAIDRLIEFGIENAKKAIRSRKSEIEHRQKWQRK